MRKLTVLLILLAISIVVVATGSSKSTPNIAKTVVSPAQQQPTSAINDDPPGTIDGAKSPELIPDDVAYGLFFRFLSDRQSVNEKKSMDAYFKKSVLNGVNVDALLALGDEFKRRVALVDAQAQAYRDQHPARSNEEAMLGFREQYKAITADLTASLPNRIGADWAEKVRQHINEHVKLHVKIVPGPMMPADGHIMRQP
jgi:hypothetical protein